MEKRSVLIADDDGIMRCSLQQAFKDRADCSATFAVNGYDALQEIKKNHYDLLITDIKMPKMSGLELLKEVKSISPKTLIIVMTAYGTVESAVEAMKNGAYDYLTKPFSVDELDVVVQKAIQHRRLLDENEYLRGEISSEYNFGIIVGMSPIMHQIYGLIKKVAMSDATVLICGESGTGKELVARALHYHGKRKDAPFIKINCAAISGALLESELFGHERGAFTNAFAKKLGRFELADTGTLLLDEISEMDPSLQSKLLRVLQEGEFDRVGGVATVKTDVRIISTTNKDLPQLIGQGNFREDLFYRLNVIPIQLPALRERKEDIPLLARHFLDKYSAKNNKKVTSLSDGAMDLLMDYAWPGNVRELENAMERVIVLSSSNSITEKHFSFLASRRQCNQAVSNLEFNASAPDKGDPEQAPQEGDKLFSLYEIEKRTIFRALSECYGNKTRAAALLGITVRTLRNKLKEFAQKDLPLKEKHSYHEVCKTY